MHATNRKKKIFSCGRRSLNFWFSCYFYCPADLCFAAVVARAAPVTQLWRLGLCRRSFNSCGNGAPLELCGKRIRTCPGCGSRTCCIQKDRGTRGSPYESCTSRDPRKGLDSVRTCKLSLAPHCCWSLWKHPGNYQYLPSRHRIACFLLLSRCHFLRGDLCGLSGKLNHCVPRYCSLYLLSLGSCCWERHLVRRRRIWLWKAATSFPLRCPELRGWSEPDCPQEICGADTWGWWRAPPQNHLVVSGQGDARTLPPGNWWRY